MITNNIIAGWENRKGIKRFLCAVTLCANQNLFGCNMCYCPVSQHLRNIGVSIQAKATRLILLLLLKVFLINSNWLKVGSLGKRSLPQRRLPAVLLKHQGNGCICLQLFFHAIFPLLQSRPPLKLDVLRSDILNQNKIIDLLHIMGIEAAFLEQRPGVFQSVRQLSLDNRFISFKCLLT